MCKTIDFETQLICKDIQYGFQGTFEKHLKNKERTFPSKYPNTL